MAEVKFDRGQVRPKSSLTAVKFGRGQVVANPSTILRRSHQLSNLEVKDDNRTLEINKREEEAIVVDLTEPIPLAPRTPKRKFSPVQTQEEIIIPNMFIFFSNAFLYIYVCC